jgi:hypothetical protein
MCVRVKDFCWRSIPLLFSSLIIASCNSNPKNSWQGTYYPRGCLTCESEYIYSPIFKSYPECKEWARWKMRDKEDKASCGRSCEHDGKIDMSRCETVVRSWFIPVLPDSPTFDSYAN